MIAAAPIDIIPRPYVDALPWEKLSVALVAILGGMQQIVTVDELKRADAALGDSYRRPSRKLYPCVAMMQSGQDRYGDDGPRSLDGSS